MFSDKVHSTCSSFGPGETGSRWSTSVPKSLFLSRTFWTGTMEITTRPHQPIHARSEGRSPHHVHLRGPISTVKVPTRIAHISNVQNSSIDVFLERVEGLFPCNPFLQVFPHAIARLESLAIEGPPESLHDITAQLTRPAPPLGTLTTETQGEPGPQSGAVVCREREVARSCIRRVGRHIPDWSILCWEARECVRMACMGFLGKGYLKAPGIE